MIIDDNNCSPLSYRDKSYATKIIRCLKLQTTDNFTNNITKCSNYLYKYPDLNEDEKELYTKVENILLSNNIIIKESKLADIIYNNLRSKDNKPDKIINEKILQLIKLIIDNLKI